MTAHRQTLRVNGIRSQVEIVTDRWGIPHIYGDSTADLFFGQGYQAARMRLWQMDLWRRRGLGQVAEILGPRYVAQDRIARLLLYRGDASSEGLHYGERTDEIVASFVTGVNAYVDAVRSGAAALAPEFLALGYQPSFWAAEDIYRIRAGGRHDNAREEVMRCATIASFGFEAERLRKPLSNNWITTVPEGFDPTEIDPNLLADFNQFMVFMSASDPNLLDGSNHWVVAGDKTATGRPILANDPHREMSLPSLRYVCHLVAPGIDVIGASEPYRPGITMGHNRDVAFGMTIFPCDQEDIYVYETSEDGSRYRYRGDWIEFETIEEEIRVRDGASVFERLRYSCHGPIVASRPERRRAYGLRAAWLQPGAVPYFKASMMCMFAQSVDDVREVAAVSVSPAVNFIFADVGGNIGLRPGGVVPRRPNWDGLMPVPGDGRYEWDGFLPVGTLLDVVNPQEGWIGNGNHFNVPAAAEARLAVSLETEPAYRYRRIEEMLRDVTGYTVEDALRLQLDAVSLPARQLVALLSNLKFSDSTAEAARQTLVRWDCRLCKDSRPAALFEVWWRTHLLPRAMAHHLKIHGVDGADAAVAHIFKNTDVSKTPELWIRIIEAKATSGETISLLEETLAAAALTLDESDIRVWGDVHTLSLVHPLVGVLAERLGAAVGTFNAGPPAPVDGDGDTVNNTGFKSGWSQRLGASLRFVFDVGDWDRSIAMAVPGQSGVPSDYHFRDQYQPWLRGEAFPLLYSRAEVEKNVHSRLRLVQAQPT